MVNPIDDPQPFDTDADESVAADTAGDAGGARADDAPDLATLKAELADAKDRLLRSQAEVENIRRRSQREMQDARRFATQPLLTDLLPVLDNIQRAIEAAEQASDGAGLLEGFKMVHQQLIDTLEKHHCKLVPAAGQEFDPSMHEAIAQLPSAEHPPGQVTHVNQQGYQLHDRVIRPAQVAVSSGPPQNNE